MEGCKSIDGLVSEQAKKKAELAEVEGRIRGSARSAAIVLVDLVGSSALKHQCEDQDWLARIYEFLRLLSGLARGAGGILVKRMGDGVLVTFENIQSAESFLDSLNTNPAVGEYAHKTAAEFGEVYYFKFQPTLGDDPYGSPVDRCARLLEMARPGATLCGAGFHRASANKDAYQTAGQFALRGSSRPEEVYFRLTPSSGKTKAFLGPLLETMNLAKNQRPGYRYVSRTFSEKDFSPLQGPARPFLLRELLNVPKLPWSYAEFRQRLRSAGNNEDRLDYYGMLVEWEATFDSYSRTRTDEILVWIHPDDHLGPSVAMDLPAFMFDVARQFSKGDRIKFRGIISEIDAIAIQLNYVDMELSEGSL